MREKKNYGTIECLVKMEKLILKEIQVLANDNLRAMFAFSHLSEIFSKDEFLYDFARIHAKNAENARRNLQTIINYLHLRKEKLLLEEEIEISCNVFTLEIVNAAMTSEKKVFLSVPHHSKKLFYKSHSLTV